MYSFAYKITCVDELDGRKIFRECGVTFADSFTDAMEKIADYYGDKNLVEVESLLALEDGPVIVSEEVLSRIVKNDYIGGVYINE